MSDLSIAEMKGSFTKNRFRIIEKVPTIDGYRDRITARSFGTLEEAEYFIKFEEERKDGR